MSKFQSWSQMDTDRREVRTRWWLCSLNVSYHIASRQQSTTKACIKSDLLRLPAVFSGLHSQLKHHKNLYQMSFVRLNSALRGLKTRWARIWARRALPFPLRSGAHMSQVGLSVATCSAVLQVTQSLELCDRIRFIIRNRMWVQWGTLVISIHVLHWLCVLQFPATGIVSCAQDIRWRKWKTCTFWVSVWLLRRREAWVPVWCSRDFLPVLLRTREYCLSVEVRAAFLLWTMLLPYLFGTFMMRFAIGQIFI